MSSIYFHIPYCTQACHYCDFHFSTNKSNVREMVKAMCKEMHKRLLEISMQEKTPFSTVYFGGGTPSAIPLSEIAKLLEETDKICGIRKGAEITLEVNPEDVTKSWLGDIRNLGINRVSLGIQSLRTPLLKSLNRIHTARQAISAYEMIRVVGFSNVSVDLIYGIPELSNLNWEADLETIFSLKPQHLSCYSLTVEPKTALAHYIKKGKYQKVSEDHAAQQLEILMDCSAKHGFRHYEISNFCLPSFESKHNSNYWHGDNYVGIGPGAHSYDGKLRSWNVSSNANYIRSLEQDKLPVTTERLTQEQKMNEFLMTRIRLIDGIPYVAFDNLFGAQLRRDKIDVIDKFLGEGLVEVNDTYVFLTRKGKLLADMITADLFY